MSSERTYVIRPRATGSDIFVTRLKPFGKTTIDQELTKVAEDFASQIGLIVRTKEVIPAVNEGDLPYLPFELGTGRDFIVFIKPENWE